MKAKHNGFSLLQLAAILGIIGLLVVILYPIFGQAHGGSRRSCASNLKQVSLGFMMYLQDYDETFPLAAQSLEHEKNVLSGWAITHNTTGNAALSTAADEAAEKEKPFAASPLFPYVKNREIFRCADAPRNSGPLWFMMNDLASAAPAKTIANPARTVLFCDGEDFAGNAGHAYDPKTVSAPASYSPAGRVVLGVTMQTAPTRHSGGGFYAFTDGHVKWMKPRSVFFPSRFSDSSSHKDAKSGRILGPNPASDKEMQAKGLSATFHLR